MNPEEQASWQAEIVSLIEMAKKEGLIKDHDDYNLFLITVLFDKVKRLETLITKLRKL